jgi:hypothetical protein
MLRTPHQHFEQLRESGISYLPSTISQKSDDLMIWMISMSCPVAQQCCFFVSYRRKMTSICHRANIEQPSKIERRREYAL